MESAAPLGERPPAETPPSVVDRRPTLCRGPVGLCCGATNELFQKGEAPRTAAIDSLSRPQKTRTSEQTAIFFGPTVRSARLRLGLGLREAAEAEVSAAAFRVHWALCLAYDAACLPFGMVGELRRKLSPITTLVLLLSMGVDLMDIRVSAEFPSLRQRAAFRRCYGPYKLAMVGLETIYV